MRKILLLIIGIVLLMTSCSPKLTSVMLKTYPQLQYQNEVMVFGVNEPAPPNAEKLGSIKIGDSGFSTNCGYTTVLDMAKMEARKVGGNAVKITQHKLPDFVSTCHRITADVLRIDSTDYTPIIEPIDSTMIGANYAIINVYRPTGTGFLVNYNLHLGDSVICRVIDDFCQSVKVYQDGYNTIWARTESREEVPIKVEFGKTYYVRCGINMGAFVGRPTVEIVDARTGRAEFTAIEDKKSKKNNKQ